MNELALFAGAGGGLLGTKLLGFRAIGYVEWEPYCQAVLAQRIKDGFLEEAPIFGDIRQFVKSGAAREYRGFADVVTAGFPCQPFSVAGKQLAADDSRNMWPATADVLCEVRPRLALLENVPGLLATGYCERIFGDLAALGFDAEWGVFSAAGVGAPHIRERLFILAHARGEQGPERYGADLQQRWAQQAEQIGVGRADVAHTGRDGGEPVGVGGVGSGAASSRQGNGEERQRLRPDAGDSRSDVADPERDGLQGQPTGGGRWKRGRNTVAESGCRRKS